MTLRGRQELLRRAGGLFAGVREEFLCASSSPATWAGGARAASRGGAGSRPAGLRVRKLYTPHILEDTEFEGHLLQIVDSGAQVRICASGLPAEMIIMDGRAAIVSAREPGGMPTYSVVLSQDVVVGLRTLFWTAWESASELADFREWTAALVDARGREILRALGKGLTDEAACRRLGMSLRTYRRRVADLMTALDAESRFQAGLRARALGLV